MATDTIRRGPGSPKGVVPPASTVAAPRTGTVAAPAFGQIMSFALPYLGIEPE